MKSNEILQLLQKAQLQALDNGINFDIFLEFRKGRPFIETRIYYMSHDDVSKSYALNTEFKSGLHEDSIDKRLKNIFSFINGIIESNNGNNGID